MQIIYEIAPRVLCLGISHHKRLGAESRIKVKRLPKRDSFQHPNVKPATGAAKRYGRYHNDVSRPHRRRQLAAELGQSIVELHRRPWHREHAALVNLRHTLHVAMDSYRLDAVHG